jgi:hypothetical protein
VLADFLHDAKRVVVLSGAGISTGSGIPDYRGPGGSYSKGHKPMVHDQFMNSPLQRARCVLCPIMRGSWIGRRVERSTTRLCPYEAVIARSTPSHSGLSHLSPS